MPRSRNGPPSNGASRNGDHRPPDPDPPDPTQLEEQTAAEELVLAGVLNAVADDHDLVVGALEGLRPSHFTGDRSRIWAAMLGLWRAGVPPDYGGVVVELENRGEMSKVEAVATLLEYRDLYGESVALERSTQLLLERAHRRKVQELARRFQEVAHDPRRAPLEALEWLKREADEEAAPLLDDPAEAFPEIAQLLQRPDLLQAPECVIERIAYRGRLTLLCGPDKCGKSTLMAHAVARLMDGRSFLGGPPRARHRQALVLGMEEALADQVRRLHELGVTGGVRLLAAAPPDVWQRSLALVRNWPVDLIVLDSLQEMARVALGTAPDDGDNSGWASVVRPWAALARSADAAVVVLHHVRRSDGRFRGAGEIAAAADCVLEMGPEEEEDPTVRKIRGRARWRVEPFSVALRDGNYDLARGELSPETLVLLYVGDHPGASAREIKEQVHGRSQALQEAIEKLAERGALSRGRRPGRGGGEGYWLPGQQPLAHPDLEL